MIKMKKKLMFNFTLRIKPSSRLIPTGAVVGVGDSSAGVMCPWLDTLDSGLIFFIIFLFILFIFIFYLFFIYFLFLFFFIFFCDVPLARHPGQWPDWVIVTSCD